MRCGKFLLGLFFICLFATCSTEEEFSTTEIGSENQLNGSIEVPLISPPSEVINSIKQEIVNSTILKSEYDNLSNTYGRFFWNKATYQTAENSRSITCIPSEKENQLTGMIVVFNHDNHMDFDFIDLSQIMYIVHNQEDVNDLAVIATIFSLQNMLYYRYRYINEDINAYILEYLETHQIGLRNVHYPISWVVTNSDASGNVFHSYTDVTWSVTPCGGGSGGFGGVYTGPIFTNGDPTTDGGGVFTPTDPIDKKIRTLVVSNNENDIEDVEECADHKICNDMFNHINSLMGNYTIGNCSNTTGSDLAIDILADLCENNIGDNTSISIEGAGNDSIIICDKAKFDEMWEEVVKEYDWIETNLTDDRLNCIFQKLINDENEIWCSTFMNFVGDTPDGLWIQNSNLLAGYAQTTNFDDQGYIQIMFNENQMSDHCEVTIMGAFLHEGIHAEMFRQLNNPDIDPNDLPLIWDSYDEALSDHDNMGDFYINNLVIALRSIYGNSYSDLQYEAIAWHGLGNINGEEVNTSAWRDLPENKKQELIDVFGDLNNNCNDDECK